MADERVSPPGDPSRDLPPDATRPMPAVGGDGSPGPDATRPLPGGGAPTGAAGPPGAARPSDATQAMPAVGAADATRVAGPLPPGGAPTATPGTAPPARWAGRAGVPAPGAGGVRQPATERWVEEAPIDPYGGRSWFTPVLLGILALVLLSALGLGIWLILRATDDETPPTAPATPAATVSAPPTVTTAPPASASPSPPPPTTPSAAETPPAPAPVAVAPVRGMTRSAATATLEGQGLVVSVVQQPDPAAPAGTAIGTDPPAGSRMPPGSRITLFIAAAPQTSPLPRPSATPSTG